jgi:hypothetical protein
MITQNNVNLVTIIIISIGLIFLGGAFFYLHNSIEDYETYYRILFINKLPTLKENNIIQHPSQHLNRQHLNRQHLNRQHLNHFYRWIIHL